VGCRQRTVYCTCILIVNKFIYQLKTYFKTALDSLFYVTCNFKEGIYWHIFKEKYSGNQSGDLKVLIIFKSNPMQSNIKYVPKTEREKPAPKPKEPKNVPKKYVPEELQYNTGFVGKT
jgi:hypothetical protein